MSQTNEFTENDLLDEYFKQQKLKILDNKNTRMNDQYDEFENYQTQPKIKQISVKNIFNKQNTTLEQNIANLRQQKHQKKKYQKQAELINQQHNKLKNLKNLSILDLQLKKMNEIIKKENPDEKLLYTVKTSMQDKYISKHLQAQLGSLEQYMDINKIYEPSKNIQQKQTIEKTKTKEEIEKDLKRIQIIQQNPLKILSNDPEFNNKIDAANLLMDNLLLKTFGISDIKKLKAETLEQLNFDRSNTLRLKEVQQNQLLYSLYNLNKRNGNFNDFFENKIDRLIDKNDKFRNILESKNPYPIAVDSNSVLNNRNKQFKQQNSLLNNKQNQKNNTNILSQQQSFQRQTSVREIMIDNQYQQYQEDQNDNLQLIQQLISKNQQISQLYQIYAQNKSENDEQTRNLIKQIQKPKLLNVLSAVSSVSIQNITVQTQLQMQNKENQIKEIIELNQSGITMKNISITNNNILSMFTHKSILENIKIFEINKVEMSVFMLDFILQIVMITNNCIEQLSISNMSINNNVVATVEQLLMLNRISQLTLSNLMLTDKQLIQLARPIISTNTLVTLDVSNNLLDDQIVYTIFLLVKYTPNLQNINLAGNTNITLKQKLQHIYKQNINIFI